MDRRTARKVARTMVRGARSAAWYDSPWRIVGAALSIAATVLALAVVAALFVVPKALGGASLTVLTGSMEPVFMPGDVVVVKGVDERDVCGAAGIGDVVTYFPDPGSPDLITHRVVAKTIGTFDDGTSCRLVTQGDNNSSADAPVSPAQVRGLFLYGIPKLGWARQWVQQNPHAVLMAIAAAVVVYLLWTAVRPARTRITAFDGGAPGPYPAGPSGAAAPGGPGWPVPDPRASESCASEPRTSEPRLPEPRLPEPRLPEPLSAVELQLRLRELAVREREVAVRESELGLTPPAPEPAPDPIVSLVNPAGDVPAPTPEHLSWPIRL